MRRLRQDSAFEWVGFHAAMDECEGAGCTLFVDDFGILGVAAEFDSLW